MQLAWWAVQARESLVCKQYGSVLRAAPQDDLFYQRLRSSSDVKMALMVRTSRNLPIKLLAGEYERILRRRLAAVGGSPDDPALAKMVAKFRYPIVHPLFCTLQPRVDTHSITGMLAGRWHLQLLPPISARMLTAPPATAEVWNSQQAGPNRPSMAYEHCLIPG